MKTFAILFAGMGLFGLWVGLYGAALMSFAMIGLVAYGSKVFAEQEREWLESPVSARVQPTTLDLLDQHCCEGSESRFHVQNSESDLENKT